MSIYAGPSYRLDKVSIGPLDPDLLQFVSIAADVRYPVEHWVSEAPGREDILYFSIFIDREPIGQILLHGLNVQTPSKHQ